MSGSRSYHAGLAAEHIVENHYLAAGDGIMARRWRGQGGELDLILRRDDKIIFVEVKQSKTHDQAVQAFGPKQQRRVYDAGAEYLATAATPWQGDVQFDVALVDQIGRVAVIENALAA